jgi:hypothetical protein
MDPEVLSAAFLLAFGNSRSPLPFETHRDEDLLPLVRERVPAASPDECLEALALVRSLCNDIYDVCERFRTGGFGSGAAARKRAVAELSLRHFGFLDAEYEAAFAAGLLWTAF